MSRSQLLIIIAHRRLTSKHAVWLLASNIFQWQMLLIFLVCFFKVNELQVFPKSKHTTESLLFHNYLTQIWFIDKNRLLTSAWHHWSCAEEYLATTYRFVYSPHLWKQGTHFRLAPLELRRRWPIYDASCSWTVFGYMSECWGEKKDQWCWEILFGLWVEKVGTRFIIWDLFGLWSINILRIGNC